MAFCHGNVFIPHIFCISNTVWCIVYQYLFSFFSLLYKNFYLTSYNLYIFPLISILWKNNSEFSSITMSWSSLGFLLVAPYFCFGIFFFLFHFQLMFSHMQIEKGRVSFFTHIFIFPVPFIENAVILTLLLPASLLRISKQDICGLLLDSPLCSILL